MKLFQFVIIRLTLALALGISLGYIVKPDISWCIGIVIVLVSTSLLLIHKKNKLLVVLSGVLTTCTFIALGATTAQLHHPKHQKHHYSNYINKNTFQNIVLEISEVLKPNVYQQRYYANVQAIDNSPTTGKILLHIKQDSMQFSYKRDDILCINASFDTIAPPLNPEQFNYKAYLERQYIYHAITTSSKYTITIDNTTHSFYGFAQALRKRIIHRLKQYAFTQKEFAIIKGLILGQRNHISATTFNTYSNAGIMHILAISGLHIGIITLFLNILLSPLLYSRNGTILKAVFIIIILWSIAFITGLSTPVVRAVTMFSVMQLVTLLKRHTSIYNTIAISALILLLLHPFLLFDVGFQLSYAAVIGIVAIHPLVFKLWTPKYKILNYFWNVLVISVAAQIGVLPLTLFYFNKFAGLFWLTNLLIIPFLGIIIGYGIVIIVLTLYINLPFWIVKGFRILISTMDTVIQWVSSFEYFIIQHIHFSIAQVVIAYIFIVFSIQFFIKKKLNTLVFILLASIAFQGEAIIRYRNTNSEFIIFNTYPSLIAYTNSTQLNVYAHEKQHHMSTALKKYQSKRGISKINYYPESQLYKINSTYLITIDSVGIYPTTSVVVTYVLLKHTPKINLERLINTIKPKYIIADKSNYDSYVKRWQKTCREKSIPFYAMNKKGAFKVLLE